MANTEQYGKQVIYTSDEAEGIADGVVLQTAEISVDKEDYEIKDISGNVVGGCLYNPIATATVTACRSAELGYDAFLDAVKTWIEEKAVSLGGLAAGGSTIVSSSKISMSSAEAVSYSLTVKYKPNAPATTTAG